MAAPRVALWFDEALCSPRLALNCLTPPESSLLGAGGVVGAAVAGAGADSVELTDGVARAGAELNAEKAGVLLLDVPALLLLELALELDEVSLEYEFEYEFDSELVSDSSELIV